jgi:von Willebrand factor type A C-terminal domain/von Willebrand factor type A domain
MAEFQIECFHNEFLPQDGEVMHAVLTVSASGTGGVEADTGPADGRTELLIVDTSGSMNGKKLRAAKAATAAAIDCIPTGVRFGVITGNHQASLAVAPTVASPQSREAAKEAVRRFEAGGGTAMGTWIRLAATLFSDEPGIRHAILLTDGKNESEAPADLEWALADADGAFQCDCRGVGDNWDVGELRKVATALRGTYDIVAEPEELERDFSQLLQASLLRQVSEITLRVWTPQGAEVAALKQMDPPLDLTGTRAVTGPLVGEYTTGAWGDESRDYYLSVRVPVGQVGDKMLAARVTLVIAGEPAGQGLVTAVWTDDLAKSTRMNKRVADAVGEGELADAIQKGVDAHHAGDVESATNQFGLAVRMANESGNDEALERLSKLVDIDDPVTGRVRPKAKVETLDVMTLETRSTRTSRTPRTPRPAGPEEPT